MNDLNLSERLRVAIALQGGMTLNLSRDQAQQILRMVEDAERVQKIIDGYHAMRAQVHDLEARREALTGRIVWDLTWFCWATIALTYVLAFG